MPRVIEAEDDRACSLGECLGALNDSGFDPGDEGSLLHAAGWLGRLGKDREFLARIMLEELAGRHRQEDAASAYGLRS